MFFKIFSSSNVKIGNSGKRIVSEIFFSREIISRSQESDNSKIFFQKNNCSRRKAVIYPPSIPQISPIKGANERIYQPDEIVKRTEISLSEIWRISTSETSTCRLGISKSRHFRANSYALLPFI